MSADLRHRLALVAEEQEVSLNQLAIYVFSKEIRRLEAERKISEYWRGCSEEKILSGFDEVTAKVEDRPVPGWDEVR